MGADDVHIREEGLPGIGRRFDLDVDDGLTLIVVARRDGSRDIAVADNGEDRTRGSVHLGREQAVAVGSLLLGARFSGTDDAPDESGLDLSTVVVGNGSPAVGRTPAEIPLPAGSDAAVVAVARDDTPQLLEDGQHRPCQAGDRLVIVARRDSLDDVIDFLTG